MFECLLWSCVCSQGNVLLDLKTNLGTSGNLDTDSVECQEVYLSYQHILALDRRSYLFYISCLCGGFFNHCATTALHPTDTWNGATWNSNNKPIHNAAQTLVQPTILVCRVIQDVSIQTNGGETKTWIICIPMERGRCSVWKSIFKCVFTTTQLPQQAILHLPTL